MPAGFVRFFAFFVFVGFLLSRMAARASAARQTSGDLQGHSSRGGRIRSSSAAPGAGAGTRAEAEGGGDGGAGLRAYLLDKYRRGQITAADLTATAWHSMQGGCVGVGDLALNPAQNSHAAEHLRRALAIPDARDEFYFINVPTWNKESNTRTFMKFPIYLPRERFAKKMGLQSGCLGPTEFRNG